MASGFNDDELPQTPAPQVTPPEGADAASPAVQRFQSCRWRKPAENGTPEHCGHRDVLPMAGTAGFTPDAWCADCGYFKAKRAPRKREPDQDRNWRW